MPIFAPAVPTFVLVGDVDLVSLCPLSIFSLFSGPDGAFGWGSLGRSGTPSSADHLGLSLPSLLSLNRLREARYCAFAALCLLAGDASDDDALAGPERLG